MSAFAWHAAWCLLALAIIGVCGVELIVDWVSLDQAWAAFERAHTAHNVAETAYLAEVQMSHRLNCLAEGLGTLFGTGLLAAVCWSAGTWPRRWDRADE